VARRIRPNNDRSEAAAEEQPLANPPFPVINQQRLPFNLGITVGGLSGGVIMAVMLRLRDLRGAGLLTLISVLRTHNFRCAV
jgi:hypothetical protein